METKRKSILEFLYLFSRDAEFANDNACFHFYDWFCRDTALEAKSKKLAKYLESIVHSKKFDARNTYTFFKNNCPMVGRLYDDFRICDLETGDVIYRVIPASGFTADNGEAQVYGRENGFKDALAVGTWTEVKNWFLS